MPRKQHSPETIIHKLREAEILISQGKTVKEAAKQIGVTEQTYYRWRKAYGGMVPNQARRLKALEKENARLKKLVADLSLDKSILEEALSKKAISPTRRRQLVDHVRQRLGVSERRACRVLKQPRSTQRYQATSKEWEALLTERIIVLAGKYGRYGYRRITALLHQEGWSANHKRVERIWRQEGLKVPRKQPKRGRLWLNDGSTIRLRPLFPNHVWSYDFVHDRTHNGAAYRILNIIDEYSREALLMRVERRMNHKDVLESLSWLFLLRGVPTHIRSDNGSEFTAERVRHWLAKMQVRPLFIEPGSPWENGYIESFNGKLRDELLNREVFYNLREAQVLLEDWRCHYNTQRPHSALGYRPPAPEATMVSPPRHLTLGLT
ncbi:MAG: IS3 family transposase [Anaerolineales bacterium]|nr:IS3 family transposase [Anaerolineales bacterium]MCB0030041.1 IS3 family transposase [Anaerolineales bacterium]MCB8963387.1 IS3 family transposase [Ardenticatenales bacterium]